jgi:fumarylpyruvate hydrolase
MLEMGSNPDRESPFFFQKISEILLLPGNSLDYPDDTKDLHHEVELVVAISNDGYKIKISEVKNMIFGYAVGVDLTKRDIQKKAKDSGRPWLSGKVFYGSAAISEIVLKNESLEPDKLEISLNVNGEIRQRSGCDNMIWSVNEIIFLLSQTVPLGPGDLIYTGTPSGVGKVKKGDIVSATLHQDNSTTLSFQIE